MPIIVESECDVWVMTHNAISGNRKKEKRRVYIANVNVNTRSNIDDDDLASYDDAEAPPPLLLDINCCRSPRLVLGDYF